MEPTWESMLNAVDQNDRWWPITGPGFFSSPFIMVLSPSSVRAHFVQAQLTYLLRAHSCSLITASARSRHELTLPFGSSSKPP
jgi:hypothetical protein